jgi:hypothetical protein
MFLQRLLMSAVGIAAIVAMPLVAAAQWPPHGWHHGGPTFDAQTATRVTGSVEAVKTRSGPDGDCCCGEGGTHLTVKTATESIDVHLGPTAWLREQGVDLAVGDVVDIVGWRMTMRGAPGLLARDITKGATTWKLRPGAWRPGDGHCRDRE